MAFVTAFFTPYFASVFGAPDDSRDEDPRPVVSDKPLVELVRVSWTDADGRQRSLLVGVNELTRAQHRELLGRSADPSAWAEDAEDGGWAASHVAWGDAARLCNRLSELEGLEPYYDDQGRPRSEGRLGYRLPTVDEWRALSEAGRGAFDPQQVCFTETRGSDLGWKETGRTRPNRLGVRDSLGRHWEWLGEPHASGRHQLAGGCYSSQRKAFVVEGGDTIRGQIFWAPQDEHLADPALRATMGLRVVRSTAE
ncbi:MAG: SUMF1/EgtB/PvdO family nonheme iron enzyme [Planctomycetota bacterium]